MKRILELIDKVKERYPKDDFFNDKEFLKDPLVQIQYKAYENALAHLADDSWKLLSDKAIEHFKNHREGQLKQHFFDQLNEAFAYQFLVHQGYSNIQMIAEDKSKKTPDIVYEGNGQTFYCEVKTINRSDEDIERFENGDLFSHTVYQELSEGFLYKLTMVFDTALKQIKSKNSTGIVYLIVNFDDFTETYYYTYQRQIVDFLRNYSDIEVYIRIGVLGKKWIHKKANLIDCGPYVLTLSPLMS